MAGKPVKLSDQLRRAIVASGMSRYAIWKATGIDQSTLSKFMRGKGGLSVEGLDKLAACLGLELVTRDGRDNRPEGDC